MRLRMEFFGIIFYVIIFAVFASAKKAAQNGKDHGGEKTKASAKRKTAIPNVPNRKKMVTPNVPGKGKTVTPNVPRKKRYPAIFMEPHTEEKYQPRIRNNNLWGEDEHASKRIVALRLMEGDPVPEGYTRIKCPYCGADNLVTKHCKQYHSCYFCRVPID